MFLYLVNADLRCLLHIAVIIFSCSFSSFVIRVGRCVCLRRSVRMMFAYPKIRNYHPIHD